MSDAITRKEAYLKSISDGTSSALKPITREEQYLAYIAGESNSFPTNPITREEAFLDKIAKNGAGGGGSSINVQPLTATENGTYDAPKGQAYDPVVVNVAGGIIDVETLPTENIDENAVYRVTEEVKSAEVYLLIENELYTLAEFYGVLMGLEITTIARVVSELPEVMEIADMSTFTMPIYVLEADGKAYTSNDGSPANAMTIAEGLAPLWKNGVDKGWSDDISAETEEGVYCVRGESDFIYQYWKYINGVWSEFISLIDVNDLPTENILNNACYHITNPESENEDKYFTYENEKWTEWSKGSDIYKFIAGEGSGHLVLPDGMTTIAPYACYGRNYEMVTFPYTITDIGDGAFYNCPNLKIIDCTTIHSSATEHWKNHPRDWADKGCILKFMGGVPIGVTGAIYELNEDNTAYYVDNGSGRTNSTDIYIVSEIENIPVTAIGDRAFYNNGEELAIIKKVTIPVSIISIGGSAFYDCPYLVDITYLGTVEQWNAITFGNEWNKNTGEYTIHCTDGDIAKS